MLVGFNYPHYANCEGYTFGPYPYLDEGDIYHSSPIWAASLRSNLTKLQELGVSVVRVYFLGNGFNYGPPPALVDGTWRFAQPDFLDDPRYRGDNDGKYRRFEEHYRLMLELFKEASRNGPPIQVIPSIINFTAMLNPLPDKDGHSPEHNSFIAGGRADIVEDRDKRQRFLDAVVKKIVALSVSYKEQLYALEVMNEPVWLFSFVKPGELGIGNRTVRFEDVTEFLARACTIIEAAGLPSTVGHRHYFDCIAQPTGTIAQFHYYPRTIASDVARRISPPLGAFAQGVGVDSLAVRDPIPIPPRDVALAAIREGQKTARPEWKGTVSDVIVGEFSSQIPMYQSIGPQQSIKDWVLARSRTYGDPWPELQQRDREPTTIIFERLKRLAEKNYTLAAVWPHLCNTNDDLTDKMSRESWASLRRATGGRR